LIELVRRRRRWVARLAERRRRWQAARLRLLRPVALLLRREVAVWASSGA